MLQMCALWSSIYWQVQNAESYEDTMRNSGINIEIEERKKIILEKSNALAKSVSGRLVVPQNLLNEVANLVEAPVPLIGKFKESFLELPEELLTIVSSSETKIGFYSV
jgi:glycyl-tRNA synthetase